MRGVNDTTVWCQSPSVTEPQRDPLTLSAKKVVVRGNRTAWDVGPYNGTHKFCKDRPPGRFKNERLPRIKAGDQWSPLPVKCLFHTPPRRPAQKPNNSLSEQGLGGPWELAAAKASVPLAPTVYSQSNNIICFIVVGEFLRGSKGELFARSSPLKNIIEFHLITFSTHNTSLHFALGCAWRFLRRCARCERYSVLRYRYKRYP